MTVCVREPLGERADRLRAMASGSPAVQPVEFRCGCRIEQYERKTSAGSIPAIRLVQPRGPADVQTITLSGHEDFRALLEGAQAARGGLFGCLSDEMDQLGIPGFLQANREAFDAFVNGAASAAASARGAKAVAPVRAGVGRHTYIPVQQILAERKQLEFQLGQAPPESPGMECFACTLVNSFMSLGLVNPTLGRTAFEHRYTHVLGAPTSQDDVAFDSRDSTALRGRRDGPFTLGSARVHGMVRRFQQTDWAKLMGMDRVRIQMVELTRRGGFRAEPNTVTSYLNEGWSVQLHSPVRLIYPDSDHWVTLRELRPPMFRGDKYRISYVENDHFPPHGRFLGRPSEGSREAASFEALGPCVRTFVVN